jgi:hypothetical protein
MSFDTSVFVVQRGDTRYKVLGADWDTIQDGDLMIAHRGGTAFKFTVGTDTWEDTDLLVCTDAAGVTRSVTGDQVPAGGAAFLPDEIVDTAGVGASGNLVWYQNNFYGCKNQTALNMLRVNATTNEYLGTGGTWNNPQGWGHAQYLTFWSTSNRFGFSTASGQKFITSNQAASWAGSSSASGVQGRTSTLYGDGVSGIEIGWLGTSNSYNSLYSANGSSFSNRGNTTSISQAVGAGTNSNAWSRRSGGGYNAHSSKASSTINGSALTNLTSRELAVLGDKIYLFAENEQIINEAPSSTAGFSNQANHVAQILPPEVAGRTFVAEGNNAQYGDVIANDGLIFYRTTPELDKPNYVVYKRITESTWKVRGIGRSGMCLWNPKKQQLVQIQPGQPDFWCYNLP